MLRSNARAISCVLLDLTMPHMDGEQVFRALQAADPSVPVVLMSGYSELEVADRFAGLGLAGYLQKPFSLATLREKLSRAIELV